MSYILLVEDNQQHADMMIRILQAHGFRVRHALRGLKGAQMAREEYPSLILMDFELPDVTGQTVTLVIRKQLGREAPPIIAVTGCTSEQCREDAKRVGCAAFMAKPFTPEELLTIVKSVLAPTMPNHEDN